MRAVWSPRPRRNREATVNSRPHVTEERLREKLSYCADTGHFQWRHSVRGNSPGLVAGSKHSNGYIKICVDGRDYLAHRLAWMYVHGCIPDGEIDHIDGCKSNNRISNLRVVSREVNARRHPMRPNNTSGYRGVSRDWGKWKATIKVDGKRIHLGMFDDASVASEAYERAAALLHPDTVPRQPERRQS
ncbi:HNH endonuclease [Luteimonas sp. RIT-PG2_3]